MPAKANKEELLQQAVEAGQKGESKRAREVLLQLLNEDNREPLYWLLMSTAVESREERIYCLQNVIFLDPDNSAARHDLELLGAELPDVHAPALIPEETANWQTTEIAAPKIPKRRRKRREEPWSVTWILASLGIGVVVIILGYYAAENGMLDAVLPSSPTPTLRGGGNQAGALPTGTPRPRGTVTVQAGLPNNPEDLLDATYTPTPIYVNTPHPEDPAYEEGVAALESQDWQAAAIFFQNALTANPAAPDAAFYLGMAYLGSGDFAEALTSFNQSIALGPQFAPGYLGRARASIALGSDATSIITDLNTSILLDPNYVDAYIERATFNMGRANFDAAEADIALAEAAAPGSALVLYYKGVIALEQEDYAQALQASEAALELDLTLLGSYLVKAEAELGLGQFEESVATTQRFLSFDGQSARGWELLGLGFRGTGQPTQALDAFGHALSIDPNLPRASYYLGLEDLEAESYPSALGYMQVAVAGAPEWFEAHMGLAQAFLNTGNPSGAFFEINSSSALIDTDSQRAQFFYWRALTLEALGQLENALADWRSLLALPELAVPAEWRATAESRVQ